MALAILSTVGACSDAPQDEEEVIPDCGSLSCEPEVLVRTEGLILPQTFKEYEGSLYWLDRNGKIFRFELADRRLTQIASVGPVDDGSADLAGLEVTADVVYISVFTPIIYSVPISGGNLTAAFTDDDPVMSIIGYRDSLVWINQFGKIRKGDPDSLTSEELLDALDQGPSPLKIGGHHLYCSTVSTVSGGSISIIPPRSNTSTRKCTWCHSLPTNKESCTRQSRTSSTAGTMIWIRFR